MYHSHCLFRLDNVQCLPFSGHRIPHRKRSTRDSYNGIFADVVCVYAHGSTLFCWKKYYKKLEWRRRTTRKKMVFSVSVRRCCVHGRTILALSLSVRSHKARWKEWIGKEPFFSGVCVRLSVNVWRATLQRSRSDDAFWRASASKTDRRRGAPVKRGERS